MFLCTENDDDKVTFFMTSNTRAKYPIPALLARDILRKEHMKTLKTVLLSALSVKEIPWSIPALGEIFLFCARHNQVQTANILLSSISSKEKKHSTIAYKRRMDLETCLHWAAGENHYDFVCFLMSIIGSDHKMLIATNQKGENALMRAASVSALRITKLILEKVKDDNPAFLDKMLRKKSDENQTALRYAIKSPNPNSRKCAQIIISYYISNENMDISITFLSYLEISDTTMAKQLWEEVQDDAKTRKKLIEAKDADGYNCFLIASRNGDYRSLEWLLSLNDEKEDEAAEDERNVMKKHKKTGETPLLICVSNDIRKKEDGQIELTDDEKQSYFKCVQRIFDTVSEENKDNLIKERDNRYKYDSLAWCCLNGNIETAKYLLEIQSSVKLRNEMMRHHVEANSYFINAIKGGNVELIKLIHDHYEKATDHHKEVRDLKSKEAALEAQEQVILQRQGGDKKAEDAVKKRDALREEVATVRSSFFAKIEKELLRGTDALRCAFQYGVMEIVEWILNKLIDDPRKRMKYLNETIRDCKSGRKAEESAQEIINKILERDLKLIYDRKEILKIRNTFQFLMEHGDINGVSMILNNLEKDEKTKKIWFKEVECLSYAAESRPELMEELLKYLGEYHEPLLDQDVLIAAIEKRSVAVVELLFKYVRDDQTTDDMIDTRDKSRNALISCVEQNDPNLMRILCQNHTKYEVLLGDCFRSCLKLGNVESVRFLLEQTHNKSNLLNEKDDYDRTALMLSIQSGSPQCLGLIANELDADAIVAAQNKLLEMESTDEKRDEPNQPIQSDCDSMSMFHPMYEMEDMKGDNILHYLFSDPDRIANEKQLDVLKKVMSSDQLRDLLGQRNLSEETPLHRLNRSTYISILEWILDLYPDPLERFKVIASCSWQRTRYGHSLYNPFSSESRIIREFFGEQLVECLEAVDFEKADPLLVKETFRFTLSWKRPDIQEAILRKISDEKRPALLDSEDLHCSDPIIFDLIRVDNRRIAEVILAEIVKINPQMLLALNGRRRSALEVSLSSDRFNIMELIFKSIDDKQLLRQYIMCDYGAFKQIYQFRKMTKLVQEMISDDDLASAVFAAVEFDEDMEFTQSLLDRVSTEKEKHELLRRLSGWNRTVFAMAAKVGNRSVMEYLMKDIIENDDDENVFFYCTPDFQFRIPLLHFVDDTLNFDIFEEALMSLKPEMRLIQLLWDERNGGSIVTKPKKREFQQKVGKLLMTELKNMKGSISDLAETLLKFDEHQGHCEYINIMIELFDLGMAIEDNEYLELILSKTQKDLKMKLLVNYDGFWSFNRIKNVMDSSDRKRQRMLFKLLLDHFDSEQVADALRDVQNPEYPPTTVLQSVCDKGESRNFRTIQSVYEKAEIPIDDDLFTIDHHGSSLLHRAMDKVCDIPQQIFKMIESDAKKMKMINHRRKSDGKCLLDLAQSSSSKQYVKKMISGIVGNIKKNQMECNEFISYFQWLIKEKDLDAINVH